MIFSFLGKKKKIEKVVILLQQGIGDTLMGIPLLRNIDKNLKSKSQIIVIVKSELEKSLVQLMPMSHDFDIICAPRDGRLKKYFSLLNLAIKLRYIKPTIFIAPLLYPNLINAIWVLLVNPKLSIGVPGKWNSYVFDIIVERKPHVHYVDYFILFGEAAGFKVKINPDITLPISSLMRKQARIMMPDWHVKQYWIAIGPGSGEKESFKRWPVNHYKELIDMLLKNSPKTRIAFFFSKEEKSLVDSILSESNFDSNRCFCFSGEPFEVVLSLMSQCHCMVAACAGPLHMAASAGIPVVGLYGPSNPGFEGAYKPHYALRSGVECSPCCGDGSANRGCNDPICMLGIKPATVYKAVIKTLKGFQPPPVPWVPVSKVLR